jgi:sulfur carrier protein ThiS
MPIAFKCYATLAKYQPDNAANLPVKPGETIRELMSRRGIPEDQVAIIMLNGKSVEPTAPLSDGDRLGLFPAVGGG